MEGLAHKVLVNEASSHQNLVNEGLQNTEYKKTVIHPIREMRMSFRTSKKVHEKFKQTLLYKIQYINYCYKYM